MALLTGLFSGTLLSILAVIAGVLVILFPRILRFLLGAYLIIIGLIGIVGSIL